MGQQSLQIQIYQICSNLKSFQIYMDLKSTVDPNKILTILNLKRFQRSPDLAWSWSAASKHRINGCGDSRRLARRNKARPGTGISLKFHGISLPFCYLLFLGRYNLPKKMMTQQL